jgi:hypothetical protein
MIAYLFPQRKDLQPVKVGPTLKETMLNIENKEYYNEVKTITKAAGLNVEFMSAINLLKNDKKYCYTLYRSNEILSFVIYKQKTTGEYIKTIALLYVPSEKVEKQYMKPRWELRG